jgi:RNA polymerase sigma-70 factor (ECF subfamily)
MGKQDLYDDQLLFASIAEGNEKAFRILFVRYKTSVYAYAYKWAKSHDTAEEITQEVFISLWLNRDKLSLVQKPAAYIYRITSNKVYDFLRSSLAHDRILAEIRKRQDSGYTNNAEDRMNAKESEQLILQAVRELSPQKQQIYRLNKLEGKTPIEIAEELHLSASTVRSHLSDALRYISTYLKNASLLAGFVIINLFR